jgi:UDP-2,3-diacylglucosamine pyrophosphatase LpxH
MFIGDLHWGSPQCEIGRFLANIKYCVENKIYVFLMGDLTEMATRYSVGAGIYEQECVADKQHEDLIGWLQPLADEKLILGSHSGNHGGRVYKETGFDVEKALARELKIPYLGDACWSKFTVGKQTYTIYSLHGRTGSRFDGTALLALERISASFFGDMVCMGHTHKCINSIVLMQRVSHGQVVEHKKHLLITGHYVSYDKGYGQTLGLPISKLGSPKVKFFANRHDLSVTW